MDTLVRAARLMPVHFVLHPPTKAKLDASRPTRRLIEEAGVKLEPRMPFTRFLHLLKNAEFVLSDGGSNQEECFYLGKPCLLLRENTERREGLDGGPCLLAGFSNELIDKFLANPKAFAGEVFDADVRPSDIVMNELGGAHG